jgi:hypothetical protein
MARFSEAGEREQITGEREQITGERKKAGERSANR